MIYCTQDRFQEKTRASDQKKVYHDPLGGFSVTEDFYKDCEERDDTFAYLMPFWKKNKAGEGQTTLQLCPQFLKDVGQTPILDSNGKPQNRKMHDSSEVLMAMYGHEIHIDDFAGLELTLFHEVRVSICSGKGPIAVTYV